MISFPSFTLRYKNSHLNIYLGCFYYLSTAINPFLYSLLSKRFRRGFCDLKTKVKRHIFQNNVDSNTVNFQRQFISVPTRNTHSLPRSRNLLSRKLASHELSTSSPGRMQTVFDEVEVNNLDSKPRKGALNDKTFNEKLDLNHDNISFIHAQSAILPKNQRNLKEWRYRKTFRKQRDVLMPFLVDPINTIVIKREQSIYRCHATTDLRNIGNIQIILKDNNHGLGALHDLVNEENVKRLCVPKRFSLTPAVSCV